MLRRTKTGFSKFLLLSVLILGYNMIESNLNLTFGGFTEILKNGSFEETGSNGIPNNWHVIKPEIVDVTVDRISKTSGRQSIKLFIRDKNVKSGTPHMLFQELPVEAMRRRKIVFGGKIKTKGASVHIMLWTSKKHKSIFEHYQDDSFHEVKESLMINEDIKEASLIIQVLGDSGGQAWLDELYVREILQDKTESAAPEDKKARVISKINTVGGEDSPFISRDGRELYFMYTPASEWEMLKGKLVKIGPDRPGHRKSDHWWNADIYVSRRDERGNWSVPESMPFNTVHSDCCPMLSYDGRTIYYNIESKNLIPSSDFDAKLDIYMVRKNDNGTWGKPLNLGPKINSEFDDQNPHISKDGKTLYFESNRREGYGDYDIYYSKIGPDGSWSRPVNMGSPINTKQDETQPWLSADEKTLYFARHDQIYYSTRIDGKWSKPKHVALGLKVAAEPSLTEDGKYLYFVSFDIEGGSFDIDIWFSERRPDGRWGRPRPVD